MLTKYHGNGNTESAWVKLQMHEYEELLNMDGADKRWWDYRALFRNRSSVYRLCCNLAVSIFGQWAGNAVLSYFLGAVLESAGYLNSIEQANITLINSCQQFLCAIFGAFLVDRVGRRPLLLFSFTGCTVIWMGMTIASAEFAKSGGGLDPVTKKAMQGTNKNASTAALAMIFLFGSIYSVGITPLQALYPVEVLSFEMRAKGMAFSSLAVNAAGLLNQFAWPVAMQEIGWKTYIIFTIQDAVQAAIIWLYLPETKGRTVSYFTQGAQLELCLLTLQLYSLRNSTRSLLLKTLSKHPPRRKRLASTSMATSSTFTKFEHSSAILYLYLPASILARYCDGVRMTTNQVA